MERSSMIWIIFESGGSLRVLCDGCERERERWGECVYKCVCGVCV